MTLYTILFFICFSMWVGVYLLIIRRSYLDRYVGIPVIALCGNISWEFIATFIYSYTSPAIYFCAAWFLLDCILLTQLLLYGHQKIIRLMVSLIVGISVCLLTMFTMYNSGFDLATISFYQNLLMSAAFFFTLFYTKSTRGQSLYIGLLKAVGTGIAMIVAMLFYSAGLPNNLSIVFILIAIFDIGYVILLRNTFRKQGVNPLKIL